VSSHQKSSAASPERLNLREHAWPIYFTAKTVAVLGLVVAILLGYHHYQLDHSFRRFFFAYLVSYCFFLAIALGGLFFVLLQHLTRAGWSVNVRRIAEWIANTMPVMAALSAPIVISIIMGKGDLYRWALTGGDAELNPFKQMYLNPAFMLGRLAFYFFFWSITAIWYWRQSVKQDVTGDYRITERMQGAAAPVMVLFGLTLTGAAMDLLMSLDPSWSSTIFGVYYFADCVLCIFSSIVLIAIFLQCKGFLKESITVEHFHDLGKFMFGFVFFWGYIAFSQYMLQWYGNMPDETQWYFRRGATTAAGTANQWSVVTLILLFGHLLIPFPGLLSRHVKRTRGTLAFWAVWILIFAWVDIFWLVMPEYSAQVHIGFIDLAAFLGIGGVFVSIVLRKAASASLRPLHDPRLADSIAFENF
jgi:hypothetical protein